MNPRTFFFYILVLNWVLRPEALPASEIDRIHIIENFESESREARKWILKFRRGAGVRGYLSTSGLETPPLARSRRYLGISYFGKRENGVRIYPLKEVLISGFVRQIRVWVYGFGHPDDLFVDLSDRRGQLHRLHLGRLDFRGWKQLILIPGNRIGQRGALIGENRAGLTFRGFYLSPHFRKRAGLCRLYLDEIEAITRDYFRGPPLHWGD